MKLALKYGLLALGLAAIPVKASATGGLDCAIKDQNLEFYYQALFSYSANSSLFQAKASLESRHSKTYATLKSLDETKLKLIQQWYEGKDLRLQFYSETQGENVPFAAVKLSIETVAVDEDENQYDGTYRFEITPAVAQGKESETIRIEGKAACSAG